MELYLAAIIFIIFINALPAFAPPTWLVLVFLWFNYEATPAWLVACGVIGATTGRAILAWYFQRFVRFMPRKFAENMKYAGHYFSSHSTKRLTLLAIFLISPISSAQLFEAVGFMRTIALRPLLIAFAIGRTISYSIYLSGAVVVSNTDFGTLLIHELRSPWAIASQIALIAALAVMGAIDWKSRLHRHSEK